MTSGVKIAGNRLQITRVFDAPRELVFKYWSQAEKLKQWSGCKEATNCEVEMDFRVGGGFKQRMQIAGKGDFSFTGEYDEIVEPQRIAYRAEIGRLMTRVLVEFFEEGDRTRVVLTQDGFPDESSCGVVSQGTLESLEKLQKLVSPSVPVI